MEGGDQPVGCVDGDVSLMDAVAQAIWVQLLTTAHARHGSGSSPDPLPVEISLRFVKFHKMFSGPGALTSLVSCMERSGFSFSGGVGGPALLLQAHRRSPAQHVRHLECINGPAWPEPAAQSCSQLLQEHSRCFTKASGIRADPPLSSLCFPSRPLGHSCPHRMP